MKKKIENEEIVEIINDFRQMVADEFIRFRKEVSGEFTDFRKEVSDEFMGFRKEISGEFTRVDGRFEEIEKRLNKLGKDNVWVHDILEKQTGILQKLDQERYFGVVRQDRLEAKIKTIEKHLKLAS